MTVNHIPRTGREDEDAQEAVDLAAVEVLAAAKEAVPVVPERRHLGEARALEHVREMPQRHALVRHVLRERDRLRWSHPDRQPSLPVGRLEHHHVLACHHVVTLRGGRKIEIANMMSVTLSCDHRAIDGALGAELIGAFKQLIENPVMMMV